MLEKVLNFVTELSEFLLQIVEHRNPRTLSQLVCFLTDTSIDLNVLRRYMKSLTDWEDVNTRIQKRSLRTMDLVGLGYRRHSEEARLRQL